MRLGLQRSIVASDRMHVCMWQRDLVTTQEMGQGDAEGPWGMTFTFTTVQWVRDMQTGVLQVPHLTIKRFRGAL